MKALMSMLCAVAATACSSEPDAVKPAVEDYDDTAQAIAFASAHDGSGDFIAMADAVMLARGTVPSGFITDTSGRWRTNRGDVTYSYAVTCQPAPCGETTDRATVDFNWAGRFQSPAADAAITREATWTITGLLGDTQTFDGEGTFHFDATLRSIFRQGAVETLSFDADSTAHAIAMERATRNIVGGELVLDVDARKTITGTDHDLDRAFHVAADITIHADGNATVILDGEHDYMVDLATGIVVRR